MTKMMKMMVFMLMMTTWMMMIDVLLHAGMDSDGRG